jgi:hypothetical protein|tara:strand:- start:1980 stop:2930 length:951 start_codon:yes stop_codon:yes gene_type:complete
MTFFNKKEDVIKIELTPYGRRLLGKGKFNPVYYAFLDDNILYNSEFAGLTADSVQAKDRIIKDTPYLRPQTNYKGVESSINAFGTKLKDNFNDDNLIPERVEKLQYCLGKTPIVNTDCSEISATFLHGEISSSSPQYSGSGVAPVDIPQLECVIENTLEVQFVDRVIDYNIANIKAEDGSFVEMKEGELMLFLQDLEGFNTKDNFSIEVFEYESLESSVLIPMKMQKEKPRIINDILVDDSSERILYENNIYTNDYFTIIFDEDVNKAKICQGISNLKKEDILVSLEVDCEDIAKRGFEVDIYRSLTTNDDLEDCE